MAHTFGDYFCEAAIEIVAVAVVNPSAGSVVEVVVPRASARREPDLIGRGLPAQDKLAAVGKFHRDDAVAGDVIDLIGVERLQPLGDAAKTLVRPPQIFLLIHASVGGLFCAAPHRDSAGTGCSTPNHPRPRRV